MNRRMASSDPVIRGSLAAMRRAARAARVLAVEIGTPFYVWRDGRVVNLNPGGRLKRAGRGKRTG